MKKRNIYRLGVPLITALALCLLPVTVLGAVEPGNSGMYATFWSLVPPLVAIGLALITKEVYISLFVGILAGGLFYANFHPVNTAVSIVEMFTEQVGDSWNVGILMFLVMLGILVSLMNKAGGSAAYGRWAAKRIRSKKSALFSTFGLGVLLFVDDYFNCLTVGSVMMPVTDKQRISRAKLSYIIDATAAPICIIAPISSWAAAVTSSAVGDNIDGFSMFLRSIPFNLYALLTILMIVVITALGLDFGPMRKYEQAAAGGDVFAGDKNEYASQKPVDNARGRVLDLVLPILFLIVACIASMVYTGGFFEGVGFIDAFAASDASLGLALGSLVTLLFTFLLYVPRRVLSFKDFADSLPDGFRQMVPAILILCFAWTLSGFVNGGLGADVFVGALVKGNAGASALLPALLFLIGLGLAFATGTSWGTFAILIPIVQGIFSVDSTILVIAIAACLAGAVCGDHISPISDTTIMASTGAQVNHITHVRTQIPYAMLVAGVSFLGYILAGFVQNALVVFLASAALLVALLLVIKARQGRQGAPQAKKR